jgi:thiamine transport system ATP-binding protein
MLEFKDLRLMRDTFTLAADFAVERGKRVAIIGPSGAGKSTLLDAVTGFLDPVAGQVIWNGADITDVYPEERPVSVIFQDGNLFPHLSVSQNVGLGFRPSLKLSDAERNRLSDVLDQVGLAGMEKRRPADLSGGQQSRVALARALVQARPLLVLDEPFSALGPALRREMLDLVSEVVERLQATLLMVTHDPDDARYFADQVVFVSDGQASPPHETITLFNNPPPALSEYLGK